MTDAKYYNQADLEKSFRATLPGQPQDTDADFRKSEARYAVGWYDSITSDAFGW